MRPIDINLASSPFRNDKPVWALLGLAAAFAFGFTGYNAWAYLSAGSRQAQLEQEIAGHRKRMHEMKLEADKLQAALAKVDQETLTSQAEFVSSILDQRNFSWTHLFNALEEVTPWDVKLVSIRPQFEVLNRRTGEGRIRIQVSGNGRSFDSFLDLQDALQAAEMFSEVTPEEYERQGDDRVDFNMAFTYKPPQAPAEGAEGDAVASGNETAEGAHGETAEAGPLIDLGPADAAAVDDAPTAGAQAGSAARPSDGPTALPGSGPAAPGVPATGGRGGGRGPGAPPGGPPVPDPSLSENLGFPVGAGAATTGAANEATGANRSPSAGRSPRAVPAVEGTSTGSETTAAPSPVPGQPQVETGQIDGKPVLKPRINPNRDPESGYRKRQTPPPPADPPAGGDR